MFWLTFYICMAFFLSSTFGADEHHYIRSHQGMVASKFVLDSESVTSLIKCVLFCELNDNILSVQYNRAIGLCTCHSVSPWSLEGQEETNSDIYYRPERMILIPPECRNSDGYIYDLEANFCFKVHLDKKTWVDAQAVCVSEGGLLAKVDTAKKRNIVNTYVKEDRTTDYYIGGTDKAEDGVWRWVADDSIIPGMTMKGHKECLEIGRHNLLYEDSGCNLMTQRYVCEIGLGEA